MDATTFGAKLKDLRKAVGMTQHDLAAKSGMTRSAIAKFETGEREPLLATAQRLAEALGVDCRAFQTDAPAADVPAKGKKKGGAK